MYKLIEEFLTDWRGESANTRHIMEALTDESLSRPVADEHRTLGRIAWHIVQTMPEMSAHLGLEIEGPSEDAPVPETAEAIAVAYVTAAKAVWAQVHEHWTDETLVIEDDLYGQKWARGFTLKALLNHEIHHRGQMTVLMRQAGLRVPGVYGPSYEDWPEYGKEPPAV